MTSLLPRRRPSLAQSLMERLPKPMVWVIRQIRLRRRIPIWRLALWGIAGWLGLQALVIGALAVVAMRRKQRLPRSGFPYMELEDVQVGRNALRIYSYGRDVYEAMLEAIDAAQECIYIESFIWKGDEVGQAFRNRLVARARAGVQVYAIFDSFGNFVVPRAFKQFPPEIHTLRFQSFHRVWHLLDPRRYALDHRKLLIVDGKVGFIGGYNLGSLYATEWRDTHLRINGPAAADLAQSFVDFWNRFSPKKQRIRQNYPRHFDPAIALHGNNAARLTFPIRDMYIDAIDRAQHHILLTNAYFIPDHSVLDALIDATGRGVRVEILLPWTSNHILADWGARGYFTTCLMAGIHLYGYQGAMIHSKTCTVDGEWSTIGTANLDRLSAVGNYEINVEVYNKQLARQMELLFACDKTNAFEIAADDWLRRPWYVKLSEWIVAPLQVAL